MPASDDTCPFCGQSSDPEEFVHDLSQILADDLESVAESFVRRQETEEARWFAEGVGFAVMWLRSRRS